MNNSFKTFQAFLTSILIRLYCKYTARIAIICTCIGFIALTATKFLIRCVQTTFWGPGKKYWKKKTGIYDCHVLLFIHSLGKTCESPVSSVDISDRCSPLNGEDGLVCKIDCVVDNYLPTQPVPVYQSCNKYGMWDQSEKLTEYLYPTCAGKTILIIN